MNISQQLALETAAIVGVDPNDPTTEKATAVIYVRTTPSRKTKLQEIVDAYKSQGVESQNAMLNSLLDKLFESYDAAIAARDNQT